MDTDTATAISLPYHSLHVAHSLLLFKASRSGRSETKITRGLLILQMRDILSVLGLTILPLSFSFVSPGVCQISQFSEQSVVDSALRALMKSITKYTN
jgi:hypothetical protein